ncbi:Cyclin-D2-2 [Gossypium australe]|uniref:Cyclin-D2-2 n=1 Tax=Gossypium australe TaxID=47621 RepID=A0A5B6WEJ6_9ROSI|nr:Cyclin-D2-2 [Gossypium australe]
MLFSLRDILRNLKHHKDEDGGQYREELPERVGQPDCGALLENNPSIAQSLEGIDFLEFKPSEIAAAVTIYVAVETTTVDTEKAMSVLTQHGKKERVMKCVEVINDMSLVGGPIKVGSNATVPSVPQSPIGVLDAACFSYKSIKEGWDFLPK